jgi:hypothetical protein
MEEGRTWCGLPVRRGEEYALRGSIPRGRMGRRNDKDAMRENAEEDHRQPVKYLESFKTFYRTLNLSLRVAFWCTVFGAPVYSQVVHEVFFGSERCQATQLGRYVLGVNGTGIVPYEDSASRPWSQEDDVWCGFVPLAFLSYWPNVIQMVIYTVYQNSGQTVMLAWQGFVGTLLAIINITALTRIWPQGANDPGYIPLVAWVDCISVIFILLISKCETNTIKFGLTWHVFFMMSYMDPQTGLRTGDLPTGIPGVEWDSAATAVLFTTAVGAALAVLSTLLPYPMLNVTRIDDDAQNVINAIENIWADSIAYFGGGSPSAKRHQIEAKIMQVSGTIRKNEGDLEASWWETMDLFRYKNKRALYKALDVEFEKINQVLYAMKGCILEAQFEQDHRDFMDRKMTMAAADLKHEAMEMLHDSAHFCEDGVIDDHEREQLLQGVARIKHCQVALLLTFEEKLAAIGGNAAHADTAFGNCIIFIYSLSVFAWRISEFAEKHLADKATRKRESCFRYLCGPLVTAWSCLGVAEHRNFAIRNTVSISLCYLLGFYLHGSVFHHGHNVTMANTLTLLISRHAGYAGTTFDVNAKRLVGVSLGNVFPILIMAVINLYDCTSNVRAVMQPASIFVYIFVFDYMHFASYQWHHVGLCAAAFGCPSLFLPCRNAGGASSDREFAARYEVVGQMIFAIVIQIVVDSIMKSRNTRETAITHTHRLGQAIQDGYCAYFSGGGSCLAHLSTMKSCVGPADEFRPMANPNLAVVPGPKTPFKHDLYESAIESMKLVVSDYEMICMCCQKAPGDELIFKQWGSLEDLLGRLPLMTELQLDFMCVLGLTRRALDVLLHHGTEDVIKDRELAEIEGIVHLHELAGMAAVFEQAKQSAGADFLQPDMSASPSKAAFVINCGGSGEDLGFGFQLTNGHAIGEVAASSPASQAGMSEQHVGWIVTHVDGRCTISSPQSAHGAQEHEAASLHKSPDAAQALGATPQAGQKVVVTARAPQALWADPRVRLMVTLKALQNARKHIGAIASACIQKNIH